MACVSSRETVAQAVNASTKKPKHIVIARTLLTLRSGSVLGGATSSMRGYPEPGGLCGNGILTWSRALKLAGGTVLPLKFATGLVCSGAACRSLPRRCRIEAEEKFVLVVASDCSDEAVVRFELGLAAILIDIVVAAVVGEGGSESYA